MLSTLWYPPSYSGEYVSSFTVLQLSSHTLQSMVSAILYPKIGLKFDPITAVKSHSPLYGIRHAIPENRSQVSPYYIWQLTISILLHPPFCYISFHIPCFTWVHLSPDILNSIIATTKYPITIVTLHCYPLLKLSHHLITIYPITVVTPHYDSSLHL